MYSHVLIYGCSSAFYLCSVDPLIPSPGFKGQWTDQEPPEDRGAPVVRGKAVWAADTQNHRRGWFQGRQPGGARETRLLGHFQCPEWEERVNLKGDFFLSDHEETSAVCAGHSTGCGVARKQSVPLPLPLWSLVLSQAASIRPGFCCRVALLALKSGHFGHLDGWACL